MTCHFVNWKSQTARHLQGIRHQCASVHLSPALRPASRLMTTLSLTAVLLSALSPAQIQAQAQTLAEAQPQTQMLATPPLPRAKPTAEARSVAIENPIENLLDRQPKPLFSNTLIPYAPAVRTSPGGRLEVEQGALYLTAKLTEDSPPLPSGVIWRIYSETTNADGRLELVASAEGGDAEFRLDPGAYLIHTAYGYATRTNRIVIGREAKPKEVILNAGGMQLSGTAEDEAPLTSAPLSFDIYGSDFNERGERNVIAENVRPGKIIRLGADTYHVVSHYGDINAVVRADVQVLPGKLTEARVYHLAADITLKLVNAPGGEAIANTSWSILNTGGDVVVEASGAFPDFVLAAGDYEVIARNNGQIYRSDFSVESGNNREVEVIAVGDQAALAN